MKVYFLREGFSLPYKDKRRDILVEANNWAVVADLGEMRHNYLCIAARDRMFSSRRQTFSFWLTWIEASNVLKTEINLKKL